MNIIERAQKVLTEIDAALALAEKTTPGPWEVIGAYKTEVLTAHNPPYEEALVVVDTRFFKQATNPRETDDAAFIAASRTLLPTSLRCLKTAIEGLLPCAEKRLDWAFTTLTTLCDQWKTKQ